MKIAPVEPHPREELSHVGRRDYSFLSQQLPLLPEEECANQGCLLNEDVEKKNKEPQFPLLPDETLLPDHRRCGITQNQCCLSTEDVAQKGHLLPKEACTKPAPPALEDLKKSRNFPSSEKKSAQNQCPPKCGENTPTISPPARRRARKTSAHRNVEKQKAKKCAKPVLHAHRRCGKRANVPSLPTEDVKTKATIPLPPEKECAKPLLPAHRKCGKKGNFAYLPRKCWAPGGGGVLGWGRWAERGCPLVSFCVLFCASRPRRPAVFPSFLQPLAFSIFWAANLISFGVHFWGLGSRNGK